MRRLPRTHKKLAMTKSEEPDFFELQKTSPLPSLEQARLNLESRKFMRLREHFGKETVVQGGMNDPSRSQLANVPHDANVLDQHAQNMQAKRQNSKNAESWREDQGNLTTTQLAAFQSGRQQQQQATKERVDQFALGINRAAGQSGIKLPESLFRIQQPDDLIKDELDLQSRVSGHSLLRQPQQQQQQARVVQQQAEMMRQQQEQQLLAARHHRAQMMQQMGQEQFLRAQRQQNEMNLLRQMDFLHQQQQQQQQRF